MLATSKFKITVDLPTAKQYVEVSGLGLFENGKTTMLTDEQVDRWFNTPRSAGVDPLVNFQEGITLEEVKEAKQDKPAEPAEPTDKADKEDKPADKEVAKSSKSSKSSKPVEDKPVEDETSAEGGDTQ